MEKDNNTKSVPKVDNKLLKTPIKGNKLYERHVERLGINAPVFSRVRCRTRTTKVDE